MGGAPGGDQSQPLKPEVRQSGLMKLPWVVQEGIHPLLQLCLVPVKLGKDASFARFLEHVLDPRGSKDLCRKLGI